jgi:pimeloyl-ACP methyl ester carboxylesterase
MPGRRISLGKRGSAAVAIAMLAVGCGSRGEGNYAGVNGLKMYYEIHGTGQPLVLLHGGGSTITTTFGRILPLLAKTRQVIAIEQQGHGHTADVDRPFTFEQMADDTAALVRHLKIERADFFGHSNGGNIALQVGMRHPGLVRKLVAASSMYKRDGLPAAFWKSMQQASLNDMPEGLKEAYRKTSPHPERLQSFHDKSVKRMLDFQDWPADAMRSIAAPTLIMIGDADIVRPEHAVEMFRLLPHARLAIFPSGHGEFIGESIASGPPGNLHEQAASIIESFLQSAMPGE